MFQEQIRIALVANTITRQTRVGFEFEDPCGKKLDDFTKIATLQCVRVAQSMHNPGFEKVLAAQIFPCYVIGNWNQTKVMYDVDKKFQEILMDSDDFMIHRDILERLPYRDFYVPLYNSVDYCGMFVHIEFDEKSSDMFLGIVLVGPVQGEKDNFAFLSLPAWLKEGESVSDATRSTKQYIEKAAGVRMDDNISIPSSLEAIPPVYNDGTPFVRLAILVAYYLASKGADIKESTPKKNERPVFVFKGKSQKVSIRTFDVGRAVAKKYKKTDGEDAKDPHWRHYWGGNGRERRECKFQV